MAEFKPMTKMMTTEPSVILKLKKGGPVCKADGGHMPMGREQSTLPGRAATVTRGAPPMPSRAPSGALPAAAATGMANRRVPGLKNGGEAPSVHKKEMSAISNLEKAAKKHKGMPASKAHKGLKTGGVVKGQGGFCEGGMMKKAIGGAVEMPSKPKTPGPKVGVLSGTYKSGGKIKG